MDLLIVEDDADFRCTLQQWMSRHGHRVAETGRGADAVKLIAGRHFDVMIVDLHLPDMSGLDLLRTLQDASRETEVLVLTGSATIETAVEAMRRGAYDYLTKPFPLAALEERCRKAAEHGRLRKAAEQWKAIARRQQPREDIIGESSTMCELRRLIERIAPTDKPVLIQGETGVGKELVARAVQKRSQRADQPFVIINCAALPEQLIESELFGHEKGAFTGAIDNKVGLFEVADGGTLFIDEIGELPGTLQPKLLRVLEDGSLRRVGASQERRVDVRVIAATNRDLAVEVREHRFREDLWYRINVFPLHVPPLRARNGDVRLLLRHFLTPGWKLDPEAQSILENYAWPGNVRQLKNVMERAAILAEDQVIQPQDLPPECLTNSRSFDTVMLLSSPSTSDLTLQELEREYVLKVLEQCQGNKSKAAQELGIHRRTLYRLLQKFGAEGNDVTST